MEELYILVQYWQINRIFLFYFLPLLVLRIILFGF